MKWRPYHSAEDKIDLAAFFKYRQAGAAYAVTWAYSDGDRDVTLGVGSDDGVRLWVNGEKVHDVKGGRQARPGQDVVKARLKKGWNEIRAKVDNITGTWELYLEFRTADGRRPLETITSSAAAPGGQMSEGLPPPPDPDARHRCTLPSAAARSRREFFATDHMAVDRGGRLIAREWPGGRVRPGWMVLMVRHDNARAIRFD